MLGHKNAQTNKPLPPTPRDIENFRNQGTSAIAATQQIQAAKNMPIANLSKIVEQRTRENLQLQQHLAFQQRRNKVGVRLRERVISAAELLHERKNKAGVHLLESVISAVELLQQAMLEFQKHNWELTSESDAEFQIPASYIR